MRDGRRTVSSGAHLATHIALGVCRDLAANSLVEIERADVRTVIHSSNQIVAEVPKGAGHAAVRELCWRVPQWAADFPVRMMTCYSRSQYGGPMC